MAPIVPSRVSSIVRAYYCTCLLTVNIFKLLKTRFLRSVIVGEFCAGLYEVKVFQQNKFMPQLQKLRDSRCAIVQELRNWTINRDSVQIVFWSSNPCGISAPPASLTNSAIMNTLIIHCQWENETRKYYYTSSVPLSHKFNFTDERKKMLLVLTFQTLLVLLNVTNNKTFETSLQMMLLHLSNRPISIDSLAQTRSDRQRNYFH